MFRLPKSGGRLHHDHAGNRGGKATQSLRFLLAALQGPTKGAAKEMEGLGIGMKEIPGITKGMEVELGKLGVTTSDVAYTLTHKGLAAALDEITTAIAKKFPEGSAQYNAALKLATGGTRGFTAALELTGASASTFASNTVAIADAAKKGGDAVSGWSTIQHEFGEKINAARAALDVFLIRIGTALLPILSQVVDWFSNKVLPQLQRFSDWFIKVGIPAIQSFAAWVGTNLVTPLVNVAQAVLPPVLSALGFLIKHLQNIGALLLPLAAGLAALWALNKIKSFIGSVQTAIGSLKTLIGLQSAATAESGAGGAAGAITKGRSHDRNPKLVGSSDHRCGSHDRPGRSDPVDP